VKATHAGMRTNARKAEASMKSDIGGTPGSKINSNHAGTNKKGPSGWGMAALERLKLFGALGDEVTRECQRLS
jgi:hypothetical protein